MAENRFRNATIKFLRGNPADAHQPTDMLGKAMAVGGGAGAVGTGIGAWGLHSMFGTSNKDVEDATEEGKKTGRIEGVNKYIADEAEKAKLIQQGKNSEHQAVQLSGDDNKVKFNLPLSTTLGAGGLAAGLGAGLLAKHLYDKKKKQKEKLGG